MPLARSGRDGWDAHNARYVCPSTCVKLFISLQRRRKLRPRPASTVPPEIVQENSSMMETAKCPAPAGMPQQRKQVLVRVCRAEQPVKAEKEEEDVATAKKKDQQCQCTPNIIEYACSSRAGSLLPCANAVLELTNVTAQPPREHPQRLLLRKPENRTSPVNRTLLETAVAGRRSLAMNVAKRGQKPAAAFRGAENLSADVASDVFPARRNLRSQRLRLRPICITLVGAPRIDSRPGTQTAPRRKIVVPRQRDPLFRPGDEECERLDTGEESPFGCLEVRLGPRSPPLYYE